MLDKTYLRALPEAPGVYRMLDSTGAVIYVGKARNLQKRVGSYFQGEPASAKVSHMLLHVVSVDVSLTSSETEALLLEANLIKSLKPKYNILLRDDKSYPYIRLLPHVSYPTLIFYRGSKQAIPGARYFGPYPSAHAAKKALYSLQRLFLIRSCHDHYFAHRSRPCLQYQIKRCSAPCVKYIDPLPYQAALQEAVLFLEGKNEVVIQHLVEKMQSASDAMQFEQAGALRDQIQELRRLQESQHVSSDVQALDVIGLAMHGNEACMHVLTVREGHWVGTESHFFKLGIEDDAEMIMQEFLTLYYTERTPEHIPSEIVVSVLPHDKVLIVQLLSELAGKKIIMKSSVRAIRAEWQSLAKLNAEQNLALRGTARGILGFETLQVQLQLPFLPKTIACFDISHMQGVETVGSYVIFDHKGPMKAQYRRYVITTAKASDDYGAMREVVQRCYREKETLPDIILIDGGIGQLRAAEAILDSLGFSARTVIGVAKGPGRKPGLETLVLNQGEEMVQLPMQSSALHLIQRVRDEAHRFAITGHRKRLLKDRTRSSLEQIKGVGKARAKTLMLRFGSLDAIIASNATEISKAAGISMTIAENIYRHFHEKYDIRKNE